jgi:hypothetical protein
MGLALPYHAWLSRAGLLELATVENWIDAAVRRY